MRGSRFASVAMSAVLASIVLLPVALPQQASAKTVKANGSYTVVSYRASNTDTVSKFKLAKKKLTVKGTVRKGSKKLKGRSFTFRVSPHAWIGESEDLPTAFSKYTGSKRSKVIKRWNRCEFIAITMKVKKGRVVRLVNHA